MKILVLGGTGFLGKNLVNRLLNDGHEVGLYVRPKSIHNLFLSQKKGLLHLHVGEFQTESNFDKITKDYEVIYHLISSTNPGIVRPLLDIQTTIIPTLRLLESCVKNKIKKIVFFSSGGTVYGIPKHLPLMESDYGQPISSYGIQKQSLERYFQFYNYAYNVPITILRISNPYGRYQRAFSKQGLIANILGRYLTKNNVEVWGDGQVIRDYINVDDVMEAAINILTYDGEYNIFNIGSGTGKSVNEIINLVDEIVDAELKIKRYDSRKVDVPINILDISCAQRELKWIPKITLKCGISNMLKLWNSQTNTFDKI